MSSDRLKRILEEVKALTPDDRRSLREHLEQYAESMAPKDEISKYDRLLDQVGDPTFEFLEDVAHDPQRKDDH